MLEFYGRSGTVYRTHDRPAGRGGRGRFYRCVDNPKVGIKVLDDVSERAECDDRADCEALRQMVPGTMLPLEAVSETPGGPPVGYALPVADGDPLGVVLNPPAALAAGFRLSLRDLVGVAANTAEGMAANHDAGFCEGDVNPGNRLVGRVRVKGRFPVSTIDADSFAYRSMSSDGRLLEFRCKVGQPEFTPPEASGKNLRHVERGRPSDAFGLAINVWMLVKSGSHPYAWRHLRGGAVPPLAEIIRAGGWPFAPKTALPADVRPVDVGEPFKSLPPRIQGLFTKAFRDGHDEPANRPSAREWADALTDWERSLPTGAGVLTAPHAAARAFLSALAQIVSGARALRAVNGLLHQLTRRKPLAHRGSAARTVGGRSWRRAVALTCTVSLLAAVTAVTLPILKSPNPVPAQAPTPTQASPTVVRTPVAQPSRFDGIPVWQDIDSEIQAERRAKP